MRLKAIGEFSKIFICHSPAHCDSNVAVSLSASASVPHYSPLARPHPGGLVRIDFQLSLLARSIIDSGSVIRNANRERSIIKLSSADYAL